MSKLNKLLLASGLGLLILSCPVCQVGERKVNTEMAKYPAEFVQAHQFDMIFLRHALPGILMFFLAGGLVSAAIIYWIVDRIIDGPKRRSRKSSSSTNPPG